MCAACNGLARLVVVQTDQNPVSLPLVARSARAAAVNSILSTVAIRAHVFLLWQLLAFPLSSLPVFSLVDQPMIAPFLRFIGALSTVDVPDNVQLPLFVSAVVWVALYVGLAFTVCRSYTRDQHLNSFPVKVRPRRA